jgi:ATP-dependent DNA helicase RecG
MTLNDPISALKGVGDELNKKFLALGLQTIEQLVEYYPRRYEDYSEITPVVKIKPGVVTIEAQIKQAKGRYVRRGMHITEAIASDLSGSVRLVWFNQPYRESSLKLGTQYYISGIFELSHQRLSIMNPSIELVSDFPVNTARILPIYKETKGLNSKQIRKVIKEVVMLVRNFDENIPDWIIQNEKLIPRTKALESIHFPKSSQDLNEAKKRLGFEEVFALSLASLLNKYENNHERSLKIPFDEALAKKFVANLPFKLTNSQRRVVWQIYQDIQKIHPMNRLIEGDVGSGKTVVALMASLMVAAKGYQVAIMAPTELLASQHAASIYKLLTPIGLKDQTGLLTGSMKPKQKKEALNHIKNGDLKMIVGTHAVIDEKVDMHKLALVIIDEQHRFGVDQRKKLMKKAGHMPHVLSMTATPIPRSLALTLYGELDISILSEMPPGRRPIITKIVSPNSRDQLNEKITTEIEAGRQVFVVCPTITDSDSLKTRSVEKVYDEFSKKYFKDYSVGLLHGKLKNDIKSRVMKQFIEGNIDILVCTTMIEVGVDIPNATIMLVESAERFGLAQLHQLRGRIGRSEHQGYCYLMTTDSSAAGPRLRAMASSNDGFKLAELDLSLRGPGAIYGTMQHGILDLRIAKLSDTLLIASARRSAQAFIDKKEVIRHYKELEDKVTQLRSVTNLN